MIKVITQIDKVIEEIKRDIRPTRPNYFAPLGWKYSEWAYESELRASEILPDENINQKTFSIE